MTDLRNLPLRFVAEPSVDEWILVWYPIGSDEPISLEAGYVALAIEALKEIFKRRGFPGLGNVSGGLGPSRALSVKPTLHPRHIQRIDAVIQEAYLKNMLDHCRYYLEELGEL